MFSNFTDRQLYYISKDKDNYLHVIHSVSFLFYKFYLFILCLDICSYVCLCTLCVHGVCRVEKKCGITPGTGIRDSCKPPCWFWDLNLDPLGKQPMILSAEPSFQFFPPSPFLIG